MSAVGRRAASTSAHRGPGDPVRSWGRAVRAVLLALTFALVGGAVLGSPALAQDPTQTDLRQVIPVPAIAEVGEEVVLQGSGWPARITVQATVCGNNSLNGSADCATAGSATGRTTDAGTFFLSLTTAAPPRPCPCVIFVSSPESPAIVRQPFTLNGAGNAQPTQDVQQSRSVDADIRFETRSSLGAWFGGSAKRDVVLRVTNTGTAELADPQTTITIGAGADPTDRLEAPPLGIIGPRQTAEIRIPVTIDAPAFGQYHVKAFFGDLDGPLEVTSSTSAYPWALIILAWLVLQVPLLGLYKRRPVIDESDDPFGPASATTFTPAPAGATAAAPAAAAAAAAPAAPAEQYGPTPLPAEPVATGTSSAFGAAPSADPLRYAPPTEGAPPVEDASSVADAPSAAGAPPAPAPAPAAADPPPVPADYRPVFGVDDLRSYLDS